ncbi:MAG: hypothetical protein RIT14_2005 [Pseudomonadota bacterium]|jgi:Flp pilus assembly pilin Flp
MMMNALFHSLAKLGNRLRRDDSGLVMTEYLILLGLLTSGVVLAVIIIGGSLGQSWAGWSDFFRSVPTIASAN